MIYNFLFTLVTRNILSSILPEWNVIGGIVAGIRELRASLTKLSDSLARKTLAAIIESINNNN
jgi:hypothetical protein